MGVVEQLGLGRGLESEALVDAAAHWWRWKREASVLGAIDELSSLRGWLRDAGPAAADEVLLALVRIGSPSGRNVIAASAVVVWALVPGARLLARRLRPLSAQVDALVAAQLWLEVRSFEWWRLHKLAANVLARTRCGVLVECGVDTQVQRIDPTWASTSVCDPQSAVWIEQGPALLEQGGDAASEVRVLMSDAADLGLLSRADGPIVELLLAHADEFGGTRAGRGQGGLLADRLVAVVADEVGVSPATVRRRTRHLVKRLAEAHRASLVAA